MLGGQVSPAELAAACSQSLGSCLQFCMVAALEPLSQRHTVTAAQRHRHGPWMTHSR